MERDTLSKMTRVGEAHAQLQHACETVPDDRPELATSLAELIADVRNSDGS